jgi:rod shape-determining protein MreC
MPPVQLSQRPFLVFTAAVILHVILISAQVNTKAGVPLLSVATFGVFAEIQRGAMNTFSGVKGLWTGYVDLRSAQVENDRLKQELHTLQVRLQEERAFAERAERLQQLLELRQRARVETVAAEIIGASPQNDVLARTIDKGTLDGVKKDMAVISPAGVVGRVILPSRRAGSVQLLIDRNAAAAALIERTRVQGIVLGQGGDTLEMDYVPGTADVKQGDLVVTSGLDGIYPKGFVIGTIEGADRGPGTFHKLTVRPAVDFSRLEEVLVVTTPPSIKAAEEALAKEPPPSETPSLSTNQTAGAPRAVNQTPRAARPLNQAPRAPRPVNQTPRAPVPRVDQAPPASGNATPPSGNRTPQGATE